MSVNAWMLTRMRTVNTARTWNLGIRHYNDSHGSLLVVYRAHILLLLFFTIEACYYTIQETFSGTESLRAW